MLRDLIKTCTFAIIHFTVAFSIAYMLTGSAPIATGIALIEPAANTVAFFFHEQVWRHITHKSTVRASGHLGLANKE